MIIYPILTELAYRIAKPFRAEGSWFQKVTECPWKNEERLEGKVVWMHCASLGEFEMGRPILEAFLDKYPQWQAVVTFFSTSGFEPRRYYARAKVYYLPFDAPSQAKKWLRFCNPSLAIFIRYDLWPNHLNALRKRKTPVAVLGMSAPKVPWFLSPYLPLLRSVFVQGVQLWAMVNEEDVAHMSLAGVHSLALGNPKYDSVMQNLELGLPEKFIAWKNVQSKPVVILGSAHSADIKELYANAHPGCSYWIVPHKLEDAQAYAKQLGVDRLLNSKEDEAQDTEWLIIPEFGVLKSLYALADGVIVGGGFGKATHNVLEATVHGKVAVSGPNWQKISENHELVEHGYLIPSTQGSWNTYFKAVIDGKFSPRENEVRQWVQAQTGARIKMLEALEQTVQL